MKTSFVKEGDILDITAATDVSAGDILFHGAMCLQVCVSAKAGELVGCRREGVIRVPKITTDVFDVSTAVNVNWNKTTSLASVAAADGVMGPAVGGGAAGDSYVDVLLNGC